MKLRLIAGLCCAFAFCLALFGCGNASDSIAGTWDLDDASMADYMGEDLTDEQKEAAHQLMFLNLNDDGTVDFVIYGDDIQGTWEKASDGTLSLTFDESPATAKIENGTLTLDEEGEVTTFAKASAKRAIPTEDEVNAALSTLLGFDISDLEFDVEDEDTSIELSSADIEEFTVDEEVLSDRTDLENPVTIADDATATIVVKATAVNEYGDPGYVLSVKNNASAALFVCPADTATIDGAEVTTYGGDTIEAGDEVEVFISFEATEIGDGENVTVDSLKNVKVDIEVYDDAAFEVEDDPKPIATYELTM